MIMVNMGLLTQTAVGDHRLGIYRIGTGNIQCYRVEGCKHTHIGDDRHIILSVAIGFMALVGIAWLMKISMKLQSNGNLNLGYAIGRVGTVYIPIPENMKGSGKINLTVQERFVEIGAVTPCDRKLMTGESVRVVATDETGLVVVEPVDKEKSK